jgi:hypothetical protein
LLATGGTLYGDRIVDLGTDGSEEGSDVVRREARAGDEGGHVI